MKVIKFLLHNLNDSDWQSYGPRIVMIETKDFRLRYYYDDYYIDQPPVVRLGGHCIQVQMTSIKNQPDWKKSSLFLERKIGDT